MNNLPDDGKFSIQSQTAQYPIAGGGKEKESEPAMGPEIAIQDFGKEIDLPKEVVSSGVTVKPTVVSIPPPVQSLGVKPMGQNIPVQTSPSVTLPLTDVQIAQGLHTSITSSLRWLAEWCRRKLKMIGIVQ